VLKINHLRRIPRAGDGMLSGTPCMSTKLLLK